MTVIISRAETEAEVKTLLFQLNAGVFNRILKDIDTANQVTVKQIRLGYTGPEIRRLVRQADAGAGAATCLLYTSPSPRA